MTHHRSTVLTAAAAAALLLTGCGTPDDGKGPTHSAGPGGGAPSASVPPAPSGAPSGCTHEAALTAADSGRTLCLTVGGTLRLTLDGTKDRPWTPVKATSAILKGADPGIVILPGDALAAYTAVAPGTARLTSSRPLCPTGPGRISCMGIQAWQVTVQVTQP
jgi:hypothetical protein